MTHLLVTTAGSQEPLDTAATMCVEPLVAPTLRSIVPFGCEKRRACCGKDKHGVNVFPSAAAFPGPHPPSLELVTHLLVTTAGSQEPLDTAATMCVEPLVAPTLRSIVPFGCEKRRACCGKDKHYYFFYY